MINNIGIVDTRKVIKAINETYNYDFNDYALTSFKHRLIQFINNNNYNNIENFIQDILKNEINFEDFIDKILIDTTEMFRTPSFWRELRDKYLPKLASNRDLKIWIPHVTSGDDLFTLEIILFELGLSNNVHITVTGMSEKKLELIKKGGEYSLKKMEVGEANYKRYAGKFQLSNYYAVKNNYAYLDTSLIKNVSFKKGIITQDKSTSGFKLIIFQNHMIYFNQSLQDKVAITLIDNLVPAGILALGSGETLEYSSAMNKLQVIDKLEKIYKKKIG
ncbi:MAG: hypothetical protein DRJ01_00740 [Bacteroidetes bacterium]|nr:MAG: hypothetical protein DRJ01_00740 [Bacteroidota bacterium]